MRSAVQSVYWGLEFALFEIVYDNRKLLLTYTTPCGTYLLNFRS
jgi:hypothetical protein